MRAWLRHRIPLLGRHAAPARAVPLALWTDTLAHYPFLSAGLDPDGLARLERLVGAFLAQKEFHGVRELAVTDAMALAVAAQACLPLVHLGPAEAPERALAWYDDFVGIVLHPGEALARRETTDEAGVVHRWREPVSGEAMDGGPVMLSWPDVRDAGRTAEQGYNVVIHEFIHKMDLRDGEPDGCPPLPAGILGTATRRAARAKWLRVLEPAFEQFREAVIRAERFGTPAPWLDPYGAEALDEFMAVACEAYFVNRPRFGHDFPALLALFDAFFRPTRATPA